MKSQLALGACLRQDEPSRDVFLRDPASLNRIMCWRSGFTSLLLASIICMRAPKLRSQSSTVAGGGSSR